MNYQDISDTLEDAAANGDLDMIREIISNHPELTLNYSLILAAQEGHLDAVELLSSRGGDPCAWADQPLIRAATEGHLDVVAYLLSLGADIRAGDSAPLLNAVTEERLSVVKLFHQHTDVNMDIALARAVNEDVLSVTCYLLSKGVKPNKDTIIDATRSLIAFECFLDIIGCKGYDLTPRGSYFSEQRKEQLAAIKDTLLAASLAEDMAAVIANYY